MTGRVQMALALLLPLAGCGEEVPPANRITGGDAAMGRRLVASHGCASCHVVPGTRWPRGHVGPSLVGFAGRGYIAGILPNTPDNLVRWLRDPPGIAPRTAMPDLGLAQDEARHIAAFLVDPR
ncbi:c-type cytochrome [Falsiroseomonas tokyonensis]|uniref:C-type cytochrome n=1 Tax=Falsiroseomonas tokyonensis TaxID=430521 RepID=A0ABV7BLY9_9PROT|nr:cytochrome C [Falsiroseomonas tokyonensis]MBU8536589.1 cytochrome C [Falsiroseomonas tokyonensis]